MTGVTCPHGLASESCEICRVLGTGTAAPERVSKRLASPAAPKLRNRFSVGTTVVVAVVALVAFSWLAATIWAIVRLLELVAVAFGAGWIGWRLGVRHGRRARRQHPN